MENAVKKGMYETDLAYLEDKIVSAAFSWLALNSDVPWSGALEKPSKTVALNEFILPLRLQAKYHYITLFRIQPGSTFLPGSGELVPLYPCVGCTVTDGEFSHALNFGKKLHLLADKTSHRVFNVGATAMYAMWLFRTEKDFATFRKAFANMKAAADIKTAAGNEAAT